MSEQAGQAGGEHPCGGRWTEEDGALVAVLSCSSFPAAIAYVTRIAAVAEELGHHPDIDIRYDTVTLRLVTHAAGRVTEKDYALARAIDDLGQ